MDGLTVGVFGTEPAAKLEFEGAVGKKSEAEGITVYHRTEGGRRISLLDDPGFPERVQGYARVASISDYACFLYPRSGRLGAPDGELAVLIQSLGLKGTVVVSDKTSTPESAKATLRGTALAGFPYDERDSGSSVLDLSGVGPRGSLSSGGTMVYIDRAFNVKGVGVVALGFVLSGRVSVHDELRAVPSAAGSRVEVRGIQVNDVEFDECGRGVRVGLSLKGADAKELDRVHWLDDGTCALSDRVGISYTPSQFYKQAVEGRDLHLQLPGETVTASIARGTGPDQLVASLPVAVPVWDGMSVALLDLNGKGLRVAGGGTCKV